jgi:hypothetical protein
MMGGTLQRAAISTSRLRRSMGRVEEKQDGVEWMESSPRTQHPHGPELRVLRCANCREKVRFVLLLFAFSMLRFFRFATRPLWVGEMRLGGPQRPSSSLTMEVASDER